MRDFFFPDCLCGDVFWVLFTMSCFAVLDELLGVVPSFRRGVGPSFRSYPDFERWRSVGSSS